MLIQVVEDRLKNLLSLTFVKNDIEKNVKERVLFKKYKERFERSLHLWSCGVVCLDMWCGMCMWCGHVVWYVWTCGVLCSCGVVMWCGMFGHVVWYIHVVWSCGVVCLDM